MWRLTHFCRGWNSMLPTSFRMRDRLTILVIESYWIWLTIFLEGTSGTTNFCDLMCKSDPWISLFSAKGQQHKEDIFNNKALLNVELLVNRHRLFLGNINISIDELCGYFEHRYKSFHNYLIIALFILTRVWLPLFPACRFFWVNLIPRLIFFIAHAHTTINRDSITIHCIILIHTWFHMQFSCLHSPCLIAASTALPERWQQLLFCSHCLGHHSPCIRIALFVPNRNEWIR